MNKLIKEGKLSPIASAALTGVWWAESGLNPHITDRAMKGKSKDVIGQGIAQWTWSRVKDFGNWHREKYGQFAYPMDTDLNKQVEFALYDMGKRTKLMQVLRSSNNVQEVVDAVLRGYENGGFTDFASRQAIDRLYARGGGYEGLMRGRMKYTGDALDILQNSSGIQLPEGVMDGSYWDSLMNGGSYDFIMGNRIGMNSPMKKFDITKSIQENFEDQLKGYADILNNRGSNLFGSSSEKPKVEEATPEPKAMTPEQSRMYTDKPKVKLPPSTVNAPNIRGGDNNVTNVNNIYLSNNQSKAAEMM